MYSDRKNQYQQHDVMIAWYTQNNLAMQLLMSVPQLVEIVDSSSIRHDTSILARLIHKLLCVFGITAQPTPLPTQGQTKC